MGSVGRDRHRRACRHRRRAQPRARRRAQRDARRGLGGGARLGQGGARRDRRVHGCTYAPGCADRDARALPRRLGRIHLPGDGEPRDRPCALRHTDRCRREKRALLHRRHGLHVPFQPHRQSGGGAAACPLARRPADRRAARGEALERAGAPRAGTAGFAHHRSLHAAARLSMKIDWDVPIRMDDGLVLREDVYSPDEGRHPAILSYGPYAKGLAFQEGYKTAWEIMARENPDALAGSSNRYQNWEVVDPEKWVPEGYACVRVDSRGAGRSPGYLCHNNARETRDIYECIEWSAAQFWCTGRVGMNGISYYASNQWRAAALKPPHLAAICVWEGWNDAYRESARHGGIICSFRKNWQDMQVKTVQHGGGERGKKNPNTGELVCGPETLSEEELERNREDMWHAFLSREMDEPYYRERSAELAKVTVPLLTAANWGGQGLHTRGNFEGFMRSASRQKWLEVHGGSHWAPFYTDYGRKLQLAFFDHFLKDARNGWERRPRVQLNVRHPGERYELRMEEEWPLARTQWTRYYLEPQGLRLARQAPGGGRPLTYEPMGDGVTFSMVAERDIEI